MSCPERRAVHRLSRLRAGKAGAIPYPAARYRSGPLPPAGAGGNGGQGHAGERREGVAVPRRGVA